jgi:hypothetical protein
MSLFGKILAFLNILGAAGLLALGALDYGTRKTWAFRVFQYNLAVNGLPVDSTQIDPQGRVIADKIGDQMKTELFQPAGGNPVVTQDEEVRRVQGLLQGKVQAAQDKKRQIYLYARILLPLADSYLERSRLVAYRNNFVTDAFVGLLRARCDKAFNDAKAAPANKFEETFRASLAAPRGVPSEAVTATLLRVLPADEKQARAADFGKAWEQTLDAIRAGLEKRFQEHFNLALQGQAVVGDSPKQAYDVEGRRKPIARLLVGLTRVLAEENLGSNATPEDRKVIQGLTMDSTAYRLKLVETAAYKRAFARAQVVVGARQAVAAVSRRAGVLRQMTAELSEEMLTERNAFLNAHEGLLEQAREAAAQLAAENALLEKQKDQAAEQARLVKARQDDIASYRTELKESQAKTADELKALRKISDGLFELRLKLRDAVVGNQEAEGKIRELEAKIQELEGSGSKRSGKPSR